MIPKAIFQLVQCPTCGANQLYITEKEGLKGLYCQACTNLYPFEAGYLDLMPRGPAFAYQSKYVLEEEDLAAELDYRALAPPLLAAGVRNNALRRLMNFQPGDLVLDNGCGNGRFAAWNAAAVALMVGSDPASLFADAALEQVALAKADARTLPFRPASFDKAFSLDVLEHFPRDVLERYLQETARVLRPGGRMLIFSNTRERSPLQPLIDLSRKASRFLVRAGVYDFERETRRKADHLKALATWEEVLEVMAQAGLKPVKVVFWNSLFTTFVEHLVMKLGEVVFGRSPKRTPEVGPTSAAQAPPEKHLCKELRARQRLRQQITKRSLTYFALLAITSLMELDLWLFGWLRCGSYFLVVEKL